MNLPELIVNSAGQAILAFDAEGRTNFANPAAASLTGWTVSELLGRPHHEVVAHASQGVARHERKACPICQAIHDGLARSASDEVFWKNDGSNFPVEYRTNPLYDEGRVVGAILEFRDISQHRRLQSTLMQAQKLESIGQLAAGIAHEINTPTQYVGDNTRFLKDSFESLNRLVTVFSRLLQAAQHNRLTEALVQEASAAADAADVAYLAEEIPKAIDQSLEGIQRVAKIVRAMKDFSHPDIGSKAAADLNKAIESTVTVARNEWKYVAELVLDLDPELPLITCLLGDLNQVVLNLVVNAAHAIGEVVGNGAKEKGTIKVSTRREHDLAVISVSDTGAGIPPAVRSKIFDPFFTTKPVGKGTGQGLAIAYAVVVEKHGGTIGFESEVGRGTTFSLRLPIDGHTTLPAETAEPTAVLIG